jgi:hypothetical protein
MARALRVLLITVIGIVLGAELLLRAFTIQPKLDCPGDGTVVVVAGARASGAELQQGCADGATFRPEAELEGDSLRIEVPGEVYQDLERSPRLKVIAVHHGDVGAGAVLRTLDMVAPFRRLRPWDYPDRDVRPIDLPKPELRPTRFGGTITFDLGDEELEQDTHVTLIADEPLPGDEGA